MPTEHRDAQLQDDITRYLNTGDSDLWGQLGPADNMVDGLKNYSRALREALVAEIRRRSRRRRHPAVPHGMDSTFTRHKLVPMIKGLFPRKEHDLVLGVVEKSIIFLTREAAVRSILEASFLHSAWQIANVYLFGIGAPLLGDGTFRALGMNVETSCYVSLAYFEEDNPFADYVVHEAAHIFHNTKREHIGLPHTHYREWMLKIDFCKRETFAYTCEVYSRILAQSRKPAQRRKLLQEYAEVPIPAEDDVDLEEHLDILAEAVKARNGWKRILSRCAPPKRRRGRRTGIPQQR